VGFFVLTRKPTFFGGRWNMNSHEITCAIRDLSHQYGFVDAGITLPQRPANYDCFLSWLSDGHSAGMNYLSTERSLAVRENPGLLLPDCRSIIVLMARYPRQEPSGNLSDSPDTGVVAAYAGGEDYHHILVDNLEQFAARLTNLANRPVLYRAFTDSVPLLERELAFSAGLGWIGRNSCLVSLEHGSFTFLAELLTDLPLEPDLKVITDHCGNCHRCIDACPTHCILPNRTIDAGQCISYLTIENRGEIPYELRPYLGNWIFGCDICQSVCPWNRKVENSQVDGRFLPSKHVRTLELGHELTLTEAEYQRLYKKSPILRAGRSGYLRNVALAIGNRHDSRSLSRLLGVIREEEDPLIRAAAVWAAGQMLNEQVKQELKALHSLETNMTVRGEFTRIL
jgi:epoxyqueuosine reductase